MDWGAEGLTSRIPENDQPIASMNCIQGSVCPDVSGSVLASVICPSRITSRTTFCSQKHQSFPGRSKGHCNHM